MQKEKLTFAALAALEGGAVGRDIEEQMGVMLRDCYERPANEGERKLTLVVKIVPMYNNKTRSLEDVAVGVDMQFAKLPAAKGYMERFNTELRHDKDGRVVGVEAFTRSPMQDPLAFDAEASAGTVAN